MILKQLPNMLTTLRLLLALPICWLLVQQNFAAVLWLAFFAGLSDGIDGWLARLLNAHSRYGEIVDPLADKALLTGAFLSLAVIGLIPIWLAIIVLLRDLIIIVGALLYHWNFGRYDMAPSFWGKLSTLFQIVFTLLVIAQQVWPIFPAYLTTIGLWAVVVLAFMSCGHYSMVWGSKAMQAKRKLSSL